MSQAHNISLNPDSRRFELQAEGHTAYLEFEPVAGGVAFTHTIVPRPLEGRGIGSALVRHALDWAIEQHYKVRPDCSFVEAWIKRHPDYQPHVLRGHP